VSEIFTERGAFSPMRGETPHVLRIAPAPGSGQR
jgi:hypothetical protein